MAASDYPTTQALAGGFIISAGCVLFRIQDSDGIIIPASRSHPVKEHVHVNAVDDRVNGLVVQLGIAGDAATRMVQSGGVEVQVEQGELPMLHPSRGLVDDSDGTSGPDGLLVDVTSGASGTKLEVCILHHQKRDQWLLPKGRKDRGESIEDAAVRETYEETGYKCRLWPLLMPTRAPPPGLAGNTIHKVQVVDGLTEPIAVTTRQLPQTALGIKMIFWYIALAEDGGRVKEEGTQMPNESFESVFMDPEDALLKLTFQNDRDIVRLAMDIVRMNIGRKGVVVGSGNSTATTSSNL